MNEMKKAKDGKNADYRWCSGCVVYRRAAKGKLEILLVTAGNNRNEWVLPKGGIEPGMMAEDSAAKEVYEEAGVLGEIEVAIGDYRFLKPSIGQIQMVRMFSMVYTGDADDWPEHDKRKRAWFPAKEAAKMVNAYLAPFILDVIKLSKLPD